MIVLKKEIPAEYGVTGKEGETKSFGATLEAMLISSGIAEEFKEQIEEIKPKKNK